VTIPLFLTLFVVLVIFMLVTPGFPDPMIDRRAPAVRLPFATHARSDAPEFLEPRVVTLPWSGEIWSDGVIVREAAAAATWRGGPPIFVRADAEVEYGALRKVLRAAQQAKLHGVYLTVMQRRY
jgi:biopolymer transport protein ExbD